MTRMSIWVLAYKSANETGGRAFTSGTMIGLGNAAGLIASNVFITTEAPYYPTGVFSR